MVVEEMPVDDTGEMPLEAPHRLLEAPHRLLVALAASRFLSR